MCFDSPDLQALASAWAAIGPVRARGSAAGILGLVAGHLDRASAPLLLESALPFLRVGECLPLAYK